MIAALLLSCVGENRANIGLDLEDGDADADADADADTDGDDDDAAEPACPFASGEWQLTDVLCGDLSWWDGNIDGGRLTVSDAGAGCLLVLDEIDYDSDLVTCNSRDELRLEADGDGWDGEHLGGWNCDGNTIQPFDLGEVPVTDDSVVFDITIPDTVTPPVLGAFPGCAWVVTLTITR